jgi:hypothetical protein
MVAKMARNSAVRSRGLGVAVLVASGLIAPAQTPDPLGYSIITPRPISPAAGTTNPSAQATQAFCCCWYIWVSSRFNSISSRSSCTLGVAAVA